MHWNKTWFKSQKAQLCCACVTNTNTPPEKGRGQEEIGWELQVTTRGSFTPVTSAPQQLEIKVCKSGIKKSYTKKVYFAKNDFLWI